MVVISVNSTLPPTSEVSNDSSDAGEIHPHCAECFKITKCSVRPSPGRSCSIVSCELRCGWTFHACKRFEHQLLCPNERVPCINSHYGCPVWLPRWQTGVHLQSCPASVVHCTMEWNRWLCSKPHIEQNVPATNNQLDVALALCDQRRLRSQQCASTGNGNISGQSNTDSTEGNTQLLGGLENGCHHVRSDAPPGLMRSVCEELYRPHQQNGQHLVTDNKRDNCDDPNTTRQILCGQMKELGKALDNLFHHINGTCCILPQESPTTPCDNSNTTLLCLCDHAPYPARWKLLNTSFGSTLSESSANLEDSNHSANYVSLCMESITRYQLKPNALHVFICGKEFRRDEFAWHYKNVHCDIHHGLNGWLEQRCPLALYGCPFSVRRFYPSNVGADIIHDASLQSFGFVPKPGNVRESPIRKLCSDNTNHASKESLMLTDLPFEMLHYIAYFLDGFSLNNLALTCHSLREVCASLLEEKGIVTQHWEKRPPSTFSEPVWKVSRTRWFFSTSFSPIRKWGFHPSVSAQLFHHLRDCPYNVRIPISDPQWLVPMATENTELYTRLKASIDKINPEQQTPT